jgi:hypothetical protein
MTSTRRAPLWAWILATPIVILVLGWAALLVLLPPGRATEIVRLQLAKRLDREVRFDKVELSVLPPVRLSVKKVELAEPGGWERGPAFSATSAEVDLDLWALLGRRIKVRRLELVEPQLHYLLRADGTTNFDGLSGSKQEEAQANRALDLDVREFRIRDGGVLLDDVRAGRRTSFHVDTRTSLRYEKGGERVATNGETMLTELAVGPLTAKVAGDLDQGLAKLEWFLRHKGKYDASTRRLALENLALEFGATKFDVSGLVDDVGPRARYDLKVRGKDVDLEKLLSWVAVADAQAVKGITGRGRLRFDVNARGTTAPGAVPTLVGTAKLERAAFRYEGTPGEIKDLSFTADLKPDLVSLPDIRGVVSGQPIAGRLQISHLVDPIVAFALRGDVDLGVVGPMIAPKETKLAGNAVVDLAGSGRAADPGSLALVGVALLHDVSVEAAKLPKRIEKVNGRVEFSPQRATVRQLAAHAGKSSYVLDAVVTRPLAALAEPGKVAPATAQFTFRSPHLDLGDLLPTTPGAPFLPNVRGGGQVDIDRLKQGRLDVTAVHADVALSPAVLESPRFVFQGYGGAVSGTAKFDLHDTKLPEYAVHAVVDQVKADEILRTWTPIENLVTGTLNSTIDFSGAGQTADELKRTLTLKGLAALLDGRIGPGPALDEIAKFVKVPKMKQLDVAKLEIPLRVEHGRVITDQVTVKSGSGEYRLAGATGFDGVLDYAVSITLPPEAAAALEAQSAIAAGALRDGQGRLILDLHVSGPAKAPRIVWDTKAMAARVAGRASDALAEQRTKIENDAREAARQILLEKLGGKRDSTGAPIKPGAVADTLRAAAKDLLDGFLGRKKKSEPLPPPVVDTTKH